ncbi:hypothetical protein BKI52_27640 [marine bacterium AO1-C]|nr:hypothetical protein BKI52_27640 [marine bacterium AO1-C]
MRKIAYSILPALLLVWGCGNAQKQQSSQLTFTLIHKKIEKSKDSHQAITRYLLQGDELIVTNQYKGGRRGSSNETKKHHLTSEKISEISTYFTQNDFYQDITAKGAQQVVPGIFRDISLKITKKGQAYNLSYAGGYKFGKSRGETNKTYKQLIRFERFLKKMLRK